VAPTDAAQHALLLHIPTAGTTPTPQEMESSHALQAEIECALEASGAGMLDGDEWGGGECVIFCFGPDADRLFDAIAPVLEKRPFPKGSHATKRYGGPETTRVERVNLERDG
jgi:hypothetical protein